MRRSPTILAGVVFAMCDAREVLKLILGADPQSVADELATVHEESASIERFLAQYRSKPANARTPQEKAKFLHYRLLQSHVYASSPTLHEDQVLYFVCLQAYQVAEDAVMVTAQTPGTLRGLQDQIEVVRKRERMGEDEDWPPGSGPEDYQRLVKDSDRLGEKILETVFLWLLQRYGFTEYGELFENQRMEYEVRYEAGRRFVLPAEKCTEESKRCKERYLVEDFGPAAIARLDQRLQSIEMFRSTP